MALILCPECNKTVSELAPTCPHCGAPVAESGHPEPDSEPRTVGARSSVGDGVRIGCGIFIVLPILIFLGWMLLMALIAGT